MHLGCFRTVVPGKCATNPPFPDEVLFSDEAYKKEFSTRITTIFGRWRIRMQYDVGSTDSIFGQWGLWEITCYSRVV
ncbi:hypothetical protein TNCV_661061 [Trichonephila clavipes]|nr:hypothetical protein TNCV_661061 [Trichonephila clavipes]